MENKVESLREALKGSDSEPIKAGMSSLAEVLQRVSTAAYQAASAAGSGDSGNGTSDGGAGDDGTAGGPGDAGDTAGAEEETVEGEFKEV